MCKFFYVSRSGYYAFGHRLDRQEKDAALAEIIAQQRERSFGPYGYRRMWLWPKSHNMFHKPKTGPRGREKDCLVANFRRRKKSQAKGQQRPQ